MIDVAEINMWDTFVGAVRWNDKTRLGEFQFDKAFIRKGWDIAPLTMPIHQGDRIYRFPELRKSADASTDTYKGLPGLLADTLPDKYGNQIMNAWLIQRGRPSNSMNPIEQLCFIGSRGMGALEYEPPSPGSFSGSFAVEINSLVAAAASILSQKEQFKANLGEDKTQALKDIVSIGTSAGGARPKAVIAYNPQTEEILAGQADVPPGYEHWLIKLDGVSSEQFGSSSGWGRVEYAYHLMAKECGIEMTPCKLLEEGGRAHFMTKRFDREGHNIRHHIQTWCGIRHYDFQNIYAYSYEQLFETMRLLKLNFPETEQMFRRMVFNVLATNYDDHTKNFAFLLKKGEKWQLAPAYDVCYSYDPKNIWVNQQTLSINNKRKHIDKSDLMKIAKENNIKQGEQIIETINQIIKSWKDFAKTADVSEEMTEEIYNNLHTL